MKRGRLYDLDMTCIDSEGDRASYDMYQSSVTVEQVKGEGTAGHGS
jgi:hypothetical protein